MVAYYLDTSAAVKLYVAETGHTWLRQQLQTTPLPVVVTSHLLRVEIWSAFARRRREGTVTAEEYSRMQMWFAEHRHSLYTVVPTHEAIIQQACQLIEHHPLRSYDAIHLATALVVNQQLVQSGAVGLIFLSADNRLNGVALSEGLRVDNPNDHPPQDSTDAAELADFAAVAGGVAAAGH
jgi:hypothetical protein